MPDYQIKQFDVLMQVHDDQKRGIAFLVETVHNEVVHSWSTGPTAWIHWTTITTKSGFI